MRIAFAAALLTLSATPAVAEVVTLTDTAFVVEHRMTVTATLEQLWASVILPASWWSKDHSWSGDAANFTLDARPGGCFCEKLPDGGGVEHARVIYAAPRTMIRLSGALGPLQGEAAVGTLTIAMTPGTAGATTLVLRYAVSGYSGMKNADLAPLVDEVMGVQARGLKAAAEKVAAGK